MFLLHRKDRDHVSHEREVQQIPNGIDATVQNDQLLGSVELWSEVPQIVQARHSRVRAGQRFMQCAASDS